MKGLPPLGYGHRHGCGHHGQRRPMRLMERAVCPRASGFNDEIVSNDGIVRLERYQRELEQELADVVEKLRRLRRAAEGQQAPA